MPRIARTLVAMAVAGALGALALAPVGCTPKEEGHTVNPPSSPDTPPDTPLAGQAGRATPGAGGAAPTEVATFAAGCFWGVEARFRAVPGVVNAMVGYTGGHTEHPTYNDVCTGTTGHAEAVQVTYDPNAVTYEQLLAVFWAGHDPTTPNRQGPDVGSQYRSAIFFHSPDQEKAARDSKEQVAASGTFGQKPVVTEIVPATTFWQAEEYHQRYNEKHGQGACPTG